MEYMRAHIQAMLLMVEGKLIIGIVHTLVKEQTHGGELIWDK